MADPMSDEHFVVPEEAVRLTEALLFAGTEPVSPRRVADLLETRQLIPDGVENLAAFVDAVLAALVSRYDGRGVAPVEVAGGWQFRTVADLAPALTKVLERPRRLPRAVMETLAIIAYHQPCTRVEIEEIRGVSLGQNVLDTLIEASLIAPRGRKEVPGRPVLWGTTPDFLRHFGLRALSDLPRREELLVDVPDLEADPRLPSATTPVTDSEDEEETAPPAESDEPSGEAGNGAASDQEPMTDHPAAPELAGDHPVVADAPSTDADMSEQNSAAEATSENTRSPHGTDASEWSDSDQPLTEADTSAPKTEGAENAAPEQPETQAEEAGTPAVFPQGRS
ncbi:SMC-Scp complex subunit ScpB [Acetobacter indonesiensis]|uniref:SMC-Scp complex subunit ScpB n=2 Tax=Acetobacter indonesiensis TaxID=104101 RepID=UPI0009FCC445